MKSTKVLLLTALLCGLAAGARAQTPDVQIDDAPPPPPTLQQRMQHSLAKQLESASRMQVSVEKQKQVSQRQTGQVADAGFFALPKQAGSGMPVYRLPAAPPVTEPVAVVKDEKGGTESHEDKQDIPPPGLIPFDPAMLEPLKPILPIPGIDNPVKVLKGLQGTAANTPKMEELLKGLGAQGLGTTLPGLLRGQSPANPAYSGLDKAPLTSFSLMDWLFGL